jgi:phytoene/squalene synthetase
LAASFSTALLDHSPTPELRRWGAALLQLHAIQNLGEDLRHRRCALPGSVLSDSLACAAQPDPAPIAEAVREECERLDSLLRAAPGCLQHVSDPYRRATRFLALAGQLLLNRCQRLGPALLERPARLGLFARLGLLLRARLG